MQPNQLHNLLCTLHTMSDYRLVGILNYESCQLCNHCFRYLCNMASISAKMINSKTVRDDREGQIFPRTSNEIFYMRSRITKQYIMLSVLAILITFTLLCFPEVAENQYAYSQSTNLTGNKTGSGVDLINIHPSPSNVKAGSIFELLATVVNNSPDKIMLPAGRCDSPLTAFFMRNVVIRQDQFQGLHRYFIPIRIKPRRRGYSGRSSPWDNIPSNQGWENSSDRHCLLPNRE